MESSRRRSSPEGSAGSLKQMTEMLGKVTFGDVLRRGLAISRTVCTFSMFCTGVEVTKSFVVSSSRVSNSANVLENKPKVAAKTKRSPNLHRNRIGNEVPFSQPDIRTQA